MTKVLWATKIGAEDWEETLITEVAERIPAAKAWALANGFDRLRVAEIDDAPPDFAACVKGGAK